MDYLNYSFNAYKKSYTDGRDWPGTLKSDKYLVGGSAITYPYPVYYDYNSRGFRDKEWPKDLSNVIWCIGDSYTSGVGVPYEHTWSSILQYKSKIQSINLGIDGAANRLIMNIAKQVILTYNPKYLAIMWSFPHRRYKDPWIFTSHSNDSLFQDLVEFKNCFDEVNNLSTTIYNTIIPNLGLPTIEGLTNKLHIYPLLDLGRDGGHFDYLTAEVIAESIIKHFNFESIQHEKN